MLRPGKEKHVLIGNGLTQHLRPFLSAVDLLLIAPDGDLWIGLELCLKLLDEREIFTRVSEKDGRHPTEASYVGTRSATIPQRGLPLKAAG